MQNAQAVYLETINGLIEENEIEKALDALRELDKQTGANVWQDLTMLYSNFRSSAKAQREGRIAFEEYRRYEAQTRYAVLELMKEIPRRVYLNAKVRSVDTFQFRVPDEARLEKIIGPQNNILKINWLEKALRASKAVCRVVCADGNLGTGFLTKEGYVFTNNHVLRSAEVAGTARIEFNYELDPAGNVKARTTYQLNAADFKTSTPDQLDFARVKVLDRSDAPLSQWGFLEFDPEAIPTVGESVTIIQHPKGEDKQIALNSNEVLGLLNQHLFYSTDTEPGSSGSPVFNKDWRVIAIHHAGKTDAEGGLIVNAQGTRRGANRGILFRDIFGFLNGSTAGAPTTKSSGQESMNSGLNTSQQATEKPQPTTNNPQPTTPNQQPPTPDPQPPTKQPVKFIVLYDIADDAQCKLLNKHLNILKITKKIRVYNVHEGLGGTNVVADAERELSEADYILALVTVDLLNSTDWFGMLFSAYESGRRIIPIRIGKADFEGTGLEKLRSLPSQGRTVSDFATPDAAYMDIVTELKKLL